jgi:hypothetical protein
MMLKFPARFVFSQFDNGGVLIHPPNHDHTPVEPHHFNGGPDVAFPMPRAGS